MQHTLQLLILSIIINANLISGITLPRRGNVYDSTLEPDLKITKEYPDEQIFFNYLKNFYNSKGKFITEQAQLLRVQEWSLVGAIFMGGLHKRAFLDEKMIVQFDIELFHENFTHKGKDRAKTKIFQDYFKHNHGSSWEFRQSKTQKWKDISLNQRDRQDLHWECLQIAQQLDDTAALLSSSFGITQIRGDLFRFAGYDSVQSLFLALSGSIKEQLLAFTTIIQTKDRCLDNLRDLNFNQFAICQSEPNNSKDKVGETYEGQYATVIKGPVQDTDGETWFQFKFENYQEGWISYQKQNFQIIEVQDQLISNIQVGNSVIFDEYINCRSKIPSEATKYVTQVSEVAKVLDGPRYYFNQYSWYLLEFFETKQQWWCLYKPKYFHKAQ
ncbi:hypothetical protein PPERSA_00683 [Pseudocohnilembus persalinus]|uniref:N-acetylmuramidase domain-containing protein n=1 Tax=Pseudocohnilembus persalinus TaxID=266149 RepID=A0A0V0QT32_PSEPJ|nr:hypothetical protein PPERSA_00683 [Pseudocohnilembus persalinus]|eukprot:KRX05382.1 hypothetical protein PPERSA_00683 [Pseudocohnilembus persalinus]